MKDVIDLELDLSMLHPVYKMKIHDSFFISNDSENTVGCWNPSKFVKYFKPTPSLWNTKIEKTMLYKSFTTRCKWVKYKPAIQQIKSMQNE